MNEAQDGHQDIAGIQILTADKTREGLAITFSDGTATLFQPAFLYAMRHQGDSVQLVAAAKEEREDPAAS